MTDALRDDIALVLDWNGLGESAGLRRNETGFGKVKSGNASPGARA